MPPTLQDIDDMIFDSASKIIAGGQEHRPILIAFPLDDDMLPPQIMDCGPIMQEENGKEAVAELLRRTAAMPWVSCVAFISEAWIVERPAGINHDCIIPSQEADRAEVVQVAYSVKDGGRASAMHRIHDRGLADKTAKLERGQLKIEGNTVTLCGRFFAGRPTRALN